MGEAKIGCADLKLFECLFHPLHYHGRMPPPRGLVRGVQAHEQLQVVLGHHVDPCTVRKCLRKFATLSHKVCRKMNLLDRRHIEHNVVGRPGVSISAQTIEASEIGFGQFSSKANPGTRFSSQISTSNIPLRVFSHPVIVPGKSRLVPPLVCKSC